MASFKFAALVGCAAFLGSEGCTTAITTAEDLVAQLPSMDLKLDVRTLNEYTGNGDSTCNAGGDPNKCNYGHHSAFYFLDNPNRTNRGSVWRDTDRNYVMEQSLADALGRCYGAVAATTKVVISCHSGGRSGHVQQQLLDAGFVCANLYNFDPGARGLHAAWVAAGSAADSPYAMHTTADNPGEFDWALCPAVDPFAPAPSPGPGGNDDGDSSGAPRVGTIGVTSYIFASGVASFFA